MASRTVREALMNARQRLCWISKAVKRPIDGLDLVAIFQGYNIVSADYIIVGFL